MLCPVNGRNWQEKSRPQEKRSFQFLTLTAVAAVAWGDCRLLSSSVATAAGGPASPAAGTAMSSSPGVLVISSSPLLHFCSSGFPPFLSLTPLALPELSYKVPLQSPLPPFGIPSSLCMPSLMPRRPCCLPVL